jgi:dihydrodipicolinate synthase/N-acetylneuraminate lyase
MLDDERRRVLEEVIEVNDGRVPIIADTSREGTEATIEAC